MTQRHTVPDFVRFTEGDCHFLARAIHLQTGWPMAGFDWGSGPDLHAFVLTPGDRVLDVYGLQSKRTARRRWGLVGSPARIKQCRWEQYDFGPPVFGAYSYRRAHVVARRLVAGLDVVAS